MAIIGGIVFFSLAFVFVMSHHVLSSMHWGNWGAILNVALLFAVIGAFYGTVVILDGDSGMSQDDRPALRTFVCGALGATVVLLVQSWSPQALNMPWVGVGFVIGAVLGWFGWAWAKYIDF